MSWLTGASAGSRRAETFLLTSIDFVRDSRAMQHTALDIVIGTAAMHCAAIVPHDEVADRPMVPIDELRLRGEGNQLLDQRPPLFDGPANDVGGVRGEI